MLNLKELMLIPINIADKRTQKSQHNPIKQDNVVTEGGRNSHLFKSVCKLRDKGLTYKQVLTLAQKENESFSPPMDIEEVFRTVTSSMNSKKEPKLIPVLRLNELYDDSRFSDPIPVVKNLFNRSEFHLCSATAKTGKTLLQLNLAYAVAKGEMFLDKFETVKGKVLVIQTEVANNHLRHRIMNIFGEHIEDIKESVFFVNDRIKLDTPEGLQSLTKLITDLKPDLVILDPLYTLHSKNEDNSSDMAPLLTDIREIVKKTEVALLLIHHQGKGKEGGHQTGHKHRGSSAFADAPDGSWSLQRSGAGDYLTLHFEMRNIEAPGPYQVNKDNETLRFNITQEFKEETKTISFDDICEFIAENPGLSATTLKDSLADMYAVSPRTISNRLRECVSHKRLIVSREGKKKIYMLPSEEAQQLDVKF